MKVLNRFPGLAACAMLAVCNVATATATLDFSYIAPTGFTNAASLFGFGAAGSIVGPVAEITAGAVTHQSGNVWYRAQQNVQSFTTDFTFQIAPAVKTIPSTACMAFVIQNTNSSTNPLAYGYGASADANLCGYGAYTGLGGNQIPLYKSIAIKFDLWGAGNYPAGGTPSTTGLYINGGPAAGLTPVNDLNPTGINLYSGHVMEAHIVYDGSVLTMVLRDTSTNAQARYSWPVDIPAATGSNSAWVGITGGQVSPEALNVLSWSYWTGYNTRLDTPTFSIAAGSYPSTQSVSISGPQGATIYYSTNGLPPTTSSPQYTGPISVSQNQIVQAVAIQSGSTDSNVASASYLINTANAINFPGGFSGASGLVIPVGHAKFNGSAVQLTDNSAYTETGAAWFAVPVNVGSFTTNFTLQFTSSNPANGMTFCIQNQNPASSDGSSQMVSGGPTAFAQAGTGLGYSGSTGTAGGQNAGLYSSVAIKFDLYEGNSTGLYTNGASLSGGSPQTGISGVTLGSGHPLNVALTYDGTTLSMKITDTVTSGTYSHSWSIDIPSTVGGTTAYVGFTGSTGGLTVDQDILSWTYATSATAAAVPVPAAPTNLKVQ